MLKHFVTALNKQQKLEVQARVHQFDYSGFDIMYESINAQMSVVFQYHILHVCSNIFYSLDSIWKTAGLCCDWKCGPLHCKRVGIQQAMGTVMLNEYDCPLLILNKNIFVLPSRTIVTHILVIHQCTNTCEVTKQSWNILHEREQVANHTLVLSHDFSNDLYCLNIFCMNQLSLCTICLYC